MIEEIQTAVSWLVSSLCMKDLTPNQAKRFGMALTEALVHRCNNHWYEGMPWKGQGYRSILFEDCAHVVDDVLRHAAKEAGIENLPHRLGNSPFVLWVDPGSVEVRFLRSQQTQVLYSRVEEEMESEIEFLPLRPAVPDEQPTQEDLFALSGTTQILRSTTTLPAPQRRKATPPKVNHSFGTKRTAPPNRSSLAWEPTKIRPRPVGVGMAG